MNQKDDDINNEDMENVVEDEPAWEVYTPVWALNSFIPDWKIKAWVTCKGPKKTWNNAWGSGVLVTIDLIDSLGDQICATFFKEAVEKFYDLLQEGNVYLFSNG